MDKLKIRPVEAVPVEQQGQTYVLVRDPAGIAPEPILIGMGAYFLVTQMDGTNENLDLQAAFTRRFGEILPSEQLSQLIEALDRAYFLESARYAERVRSIAEEFEHDPQRPAALAGLAYEKDPVQLRQEIAAYFTRLGTVLPNPPFLEKAIIQFGIADATSHYHVPLLASPWSFTTYRGS